MTYEKGIPEYALQPARAPQMTSAEAIYHTEKIIYPGERQMAIYQFEEDILVPDTKADMREILLMDASCDVMPSEKKIMPKTDDLLNLTGTISIQTLYNPDNDSNEPVAITSKVPYKYQWNLNPLDQAEGVFSCQVKSLEHMIINERKFRVKITLEFNSQLFCQRDFSFFDGLKDESLEMKTEEISVGCLALVKKDEVSIDEQFKPREAEGLPECILKQNCSIMENYRQVTTEKVVINGFIFVNLLYLVSGDEEKESALCHHHQRIEFTQFIPIEKEHRGKKWSAVKTSFSNKDLLVVIEQDEAQPQERFFRIKGDLQTRIELYENRSREMVIDAYHREKNFTCQFQKRNVLGISESSITEISIREIVNLQEGAKASEAVCCNSKIVNCECAPERGKLLISGTIQSSCLWKSERGAYQTTKALNDFQHSVDFEKAQKETKAECQPFIKNCWITLINEKQVELNCTIVLCSETYEEKQIILLEEPGFVDGICGKDYPMVVVTMKKGECLWDLAKRYRTTEHQIREVNRLEGEPEAGQKLLMIK